MATQTQWLKLAVWILLISTVASIPCTLKSEGGACDEIWSSSGGAIFVDGNTKPEGYFVNQTICFEPDTYVGLWIEEVYGHPSNPTIFTNCGGQVVVSRTNGDPVAIGYSRYVHLTGTGSNEQYGILVNNAGNSQTFVNIRTDTSDIEVDHIEVDGTLAGNNGYAGVQINNYPYCGFDENFVQRNTILHDLYVHDVHGEGLYIGTSHWGAKETPNYNPGFSRDCDGTTFLFIEPDLIGVQVYNCIIERTGRDSIQVGGGVEGVFVTDNIMLDFGLAESSGHMGGLLLNPGTRGYFARNYVAQTLAEIKGKGVGLQLQGQGDTLIENIYIANAGNGIMPLRNTAANSADEDAPNKYSDTIINHATVVGSQAETIYMFCQLGYAENAIQIYNTLIVLESEDSVLSGANGNDFSCLQEFDSSVVVVNSLEEAKLGEDGCLKNDSPAINQGIDVLETDLYGVTRSSNDVGSVARCADIAATTVQPGTDIQPDTTEGISTSTSNNDSGTVSDSSDSEQTDIVDHSLDSEQEEGEEQEVDNIADKIDDTESATASNIDNSEEGDSYAHPIKVGLLCLGLGIVF
eukprot:TRINITY_DN11697_c0_g1_i1.p1 TRINITY_DN11697_c0_g1~~TRINITY_DN11697_c0_g1_i1.p1  ORF type:complete len:577 (-),score=132.03 TRINITY_DN11697_c0_g1_i1:133-1863(-)